MISLQVINVRPNLQGNCYGTELAQCISDYLLDIIDSFLSAKFKFRVEFEAEVVSEGGHSLGSTICGMLEIQYDNYCCFNEKNPRYLDFTGGVYD